MALEEPATGIRVRQNGAGLPGSDCVINAAIVQQAIDSQKYQEEAVIRMSYTVRFIPQGLRNTLS